jgi:cytoskeletal protein CcmA (bactofilin family)
MTTAEGDITALEAEDIDLNGRADSLAAAVASNDGDITSLQTRMTTAEGDITALEAEDIDLNGRADSLAAAVASNDGDITSLQTRMTTAEGDITALEAEDIDLHGRADSLAAAVASNDTDIANLQSELDATQTGAGLNPNGTYSANGAANYINASTSLVDADNDLDSALRSEVIRATGREDSIINVLYWNKSIPTTGPYAGDVIVSLDPDIERIVDENLDVKVQNLEVVNSVSGDYGNFDVVTAQEGYIDYLETDDIQNSGKITTQTLWWTNGKAVGSNSHTDLDGTLNVDRNATFNDFVTMNDSLNVKMFADFDANVNIDGAVQIDLTLDVDGNTDLDGTLNVEDAATFQDNVQVDDNLNVDGITTLDETTVDVSFTVNGNSDLNGTLDVSGNTDIDGTLNVQGATTLQSTLNGQGNADFDQDLNVDGITTLDDTQVDGPLTVNGTTDLNGTLDVSGDVDMHSTLDVTGNTTVGGTLGVTGNGTFSADIDVDGTSNLDNTDIDGTLDVSGDVDMHSTLDVTGNTTVGGTLGVTGNGTFSADIDVDGTSNLDNTDIDGTLDVLLDATFQDDVTVQDSLKVNGSADIDQNLTVNGNTDLDGTLDVDGTANFDDFATFNDSVLVGMHLRINTPAYSGAISTVLDDPEFEVRNDVGSLIFQVDGHNDQTTVQNLLIQNLMTVNGNFIASGDISGDEINASEGMTAGTNVFANNWPTATEWNSVVRKDYVDYHRMAQTDVPTAFSYDASLTGIDTVGTGNNAVYYLNGNVVLYNDSTDTDNDNYTITVKGANFQNLLTALGGTTEVSAQLWLENNFLDLSTTHDFDVVNDSTITFNISYDDIDPMTDCTSGIVRPTLALGTATGGFHMTGLHFFFDIVE